MKGRKRGGPPKTGVCNRASLLLAWNDVCEQRSFLSFLLSEFDLRRFQACHACTRIVALHLIMQLKSALPYQIISKKLRNQIKM